MSNQAFGLIIIIITGITGFAGGGALTLAITRAEPGPHDLVEMHAEWYGQGVEDGMELGGLLCQRMLQMQQRPPQPPPYRNDDA